MKKGGSIQKFTLNGLERTLSSDNELQFTLGGTYVSEKQDTNTGIPFFLIDSISAVAAGFEERVSHADGSLATLDAAMQKCAKEGAVSCSVKMADGTTYSALGGVMIIPDDAPGGMMGTREGKVAYACHPAEGKWI